MQVCNVLRAARWKYRTQKLAKNSPSVHHRTIISRATVSSQLWEVLPIGKKLVKEQYLVHMYSQYGEHMENFGPLTAGTSWRVWARQLISTGFALSRLGSVTARHSSSGPGVSQTLQR